MSVYDRPVTRAKFSKHTGGEERAKRAHARLSEEQQIQAKINSCHYELRVLERQIEAVKRKLAKSEAELEQFRTRHVIPVTRYVAADTNAGGGE